MIMSKLLIFDGNSIINRAFYAFSGRGQILATSSGMYTNAVFGFINILVKYIDDIKPEYICVTFDLKGPTFRHKMYSSYKANRKGMPDELAMQLPLVKEVLDAMNINRYELEGYEADDIIGTISKRAERKSLETIIVTGDRDALQLVSDRVSVSLPVTKKSGTETEFYSYDLVKSKYGIEPKMLIDVKGLMGDSSDNIPGVYGVGEKSALELIKTYKTLENVYTNIQSITKKALKSKLEKDKEAAFMSKKLVTIDIDIPIEAEHEKMKLKEYNNDKLYEIFKKLEFKKFIEKFNLKAEYKKVDESVEYIDNNDKFDNLVKTLLTKKEVAIFSLIEGENIKDKKLNFVTISDEDKSYFINTEKINSEEFYIGLEKFISNKNIKKILYNVKTLMLFLAEKNISICGEVFDIYLASYLLNPTSNSLELSSLALDYLDISIPSMEDIFGKGKKSLQYKEVDEKVLIEFMIVYNRVIFQFKSFLEDKLESSSQMNLFKNVEISLIKVLADMEFNGISIDMDENNILSEELTKNLKMLESNIYFMAGEEFNINSPKQLGVILFEKLSLPIVKKTKTGYSTDVEVLEKISDKHEIVSRILEYRQYMKLNSTYVEGLKNVINKKTKKIHSNFNQMITATGRISSTEPNLQNIPIKLELGRRIRKMFIPERGCCLISADYSQIELRILAHLADDDYMIESFEKGEDIHKNTAAKVFRVKMEDVTSIMRSRAKAVNFGIIYGISDFGLAKDLSISKKEAKKYIDEYFLTYPKVKIYLDNLIIDAKEKGYVRTILNRIRYLPELKSKNHNIRSFGERAAMNTPIQGSAADIIKVAMVDVYEKLNKLNLKSRLILQVHDELVINTNESEKDKVYEILKESMKNAIKLKVPLELSISEGSSWYETK
ncbi:MAG: DNA polymerase I [Clostridiales bacterium]